MSDSGNSLLQVGYAPPARSGWRWIIALLAGILTTAVALAIAWETEHASNGDFTIIGFYLWGIVPVGALILGMGAAVGYWAGARLTGTRITRSFLVGVAVIAIAAHFAMHYIEFKMQGPLVHKDTGVPVGFAEYYDATTRAIRFESMTKHSTDDSNDDDSGLGTLGYGVRGLEIIGFAGGTILTPLLLRRLKYCDLCQRYQNRKRLASLPVAALSTVREMNEAANSGDVAPIRSLLSQVSPIAKPENRFEIFLSRCPQCGHGVFHIDCVRQTSRRNSTTTEYSSVPVDADFVKAMSQ